MVYISNVLVFNKQADKILLCKRSHEPYKGLIDLVGGKAEANEDGLTCAYRELFEETGITADDIVLDHLMDFTPDITVRIYFGQLHKEVVLVEEVNPLLWCDLNCNFGDTSMYSGNGYLVSILAEIAKRAVLPMPIITTHDVTLHGQTPSHYLTLQPLSDHHLPHLYRWNDDPEVLYWCEGDDIEHNTHEQVHGIYGCVSKNALCFLIVADDTPIGECWLQEMNMKDILAKHPNQDIRRIDLMIGEKAYWGKGIGSAVIGMLTKYAFEVAQADQVYGLVFDYNIRSQKAFIKNGYTLVDTIACEPGKKMKQDMHYAITNVQYHK